MENPIQITTKDPKKVEAGKKLTEYNRQQRKKLKALEEKERELAVMGPDMTPSFESTQSTGETNYELLGIVGFIAMGGSAYYLYIKRKEEKPKKKKRVVPTEQPQTTQVARLEQIAPTKTPAHSRKFDMK